MAVRAIANTSPIGLAAALIATAVLACSARPHAAPELDGGPSMTARGATLELPIPGGTLAARGDTLSMDPKARWISLEGDAAVTIDGTYRLEALADEIRVVPDGPAIEMTGRVCAVLTALAPVAPPKEEAR